MQALILAGGKGARLEPLTSDTPKPVVPVGNKPFLATQIQLLKSIGITDIILSLNYNPFAIKEILGDGSALGVRISYLIEPAPMGTAGGYKFAEKSIQSTTIVLNGDILTDIDLHELVRQHKKYDSAATIVLAEVENPAAYGLVEVGENHRISKFLEKPDVDYIERLKINTINAGIYILEPKILSYIPERENYSFEYQLFPDLLRRKENFRAFVAARNYWLDIGTPQRYLQAHHDLITGKIKNFQIYRDSKFESSEKSEIDDISLIDEGCVISAGAKIINSVLGRDVFIGENSIVQNSVIWSRTKIDSRSHILDSIIGNDCRIGKNVSLSKGAVLGSNTRMDSNPLVLNKGAFTRC
jgi:NDP-sugar pyrophosphorylase family protein